MAKTKTWVSNVGEVFEGTQAELCKERGIKNRSGFTRPTGAVDKEGYRWKQEGETFKKPNLYLGFKYCTGFLDGKKRTWWEAPSNEAMVYSLAREEGDTALMDTIERNYTVIDNQKDAINYILGDIQYDTKEENIAAIDEMIDSLYDELKQDIRSDNPDKNVMWTLFDIIDKL